MQQSVKSSYYQKIKNTTYSVIKGVANKSVQFYQFSKQQTIKLINSQIAKSYQMKGTNITQSSLLKSQTYQPFLKNLHDTLNNPTALKIRSLVQKYGLIIVSLPGIEYLLKIEFLKTFGFTALGVKYGSWAAWIQAKYYGAYIAKDSIFSYLQSNGATGCFDPTLIILLLAAGGIFYYLCIYNKYDESSYKWETKDLIKIPQITVPKSVLYEKGKYNIEWANLSYENSKFWKIVV